MKTSDRGRASAATGWELTALIAGRASVHPLPLRGTIVLGRGGQADLALEDASVSRRHATLHLGDEVVVEDLGSANGTRVITTVVDPQMTAQTLDQRLAPNARTKVPASAAIHLGSVVVLLRPRTERAAPEAFSTNGAIVASPAMKRVVELLERIALAPISVLLVGETGVGKDVFARAIHAASPRKAGPYTAINCAALPDHLIESELFGHEKGAFTGAGQAKLGLIEASTNGTAFLDEIGELPLPQQGKLLRVLEGGEVLRVGALKPRPIDVRFVAATNRDLKADADRGTFRRDLYFRLNGMTLAIPPLRERREDVHPLARHFAESAAAKLGRSAPVLSPETLTALDRYPFPGNIRELRNIVERAVALTVDGVISPEHLVLETAGSGGFPTVPSYAGESAALSDPVAEADRQRILEALAQCAGNQTRAAEVLGISRRTLVSRLADYGIVRPRAAKR
ncbi:MAG TPA: sigma 54-interacting transcriptional regulator [Labilithrix sp.]|nr:sigma 54-interacting transcriptional regulator [Labilithrix sp.]